MRPHIVIRPWSKMWWSHWIRLVYDGQSTAFMTSLAKSGKSLTVKRSDAPSDIAAGMLVPVVIGSHEHRMWMRFWKERHNVALPQPRITPVIFQRAAIPSAVDWMDEADFDAASGF